ncbi:hypothetical protein ACFYN3_42445 [Streptomyces lavendulae]|uniref:hypothetical protein n=1 Tax=Streptomyces lavendulae TaxID=1914 RepID=UPI00367E0B1A
MTNAGGAVIAATFPIAEPWDFWWSEAAPTRNWRPPLARHDLGRHLHCEGNDLTLSGHVALLHEAGFLEAGSVWQFGHSHVVVAVR